MSRNKTRNKERQSLLNRKRRDRNKQGKKNAQKTRAKIHVPRRKQYEHNSERKDVIDNHIHLTTPKTFNLLKNQDEMLRFYDELRDAIDRKRKTKIHMEDMAEVSVGSLLYLVAILMNAQKTGTPISGTIPHNRQCASIIRTSGFFDFVTTLKWIPPNRKTKIAKITYHNSHDPKEIRRLCKFVCDCLGKDVSNDAEPLFATLSELVQNTIGHAYGEENEKGNWYVAAEHLQDKNEVEVTFLDTGRGIPDTVSKRFFEKLHIPFLGRDEQLILSALKGELRTSTGEKYRGKGLPEIYRYSIKGDIKQLAIASGEGYIYKNEPYHLGNKFFGTLFSFRI